MTHQITIRAAQVQDAPIIAEVVAMAIGDMATLCNYCGEEYIAILEEVARTTQTQYSYENTLIAEVEGQVAGAIVGYDGALLERLRANTFKIINSMVGRVPTLANETEAGEYYLDSLGIRAAYRGRGVGKALIEAFCAKAFNEGHPRVGLIVEQGNLTAERLYSSLGFKRVGERVFFAHRMNHLQRLNTTKK